MLKPVNVVVGTDPEGFFSKDGAIIGSEKVLPEAGLKSGSAIKPHVVLDGVQFELNPPARGSVNLLGREVSTAFELLSRQLRKFNGQISIDWRGLIEIEKVELDSLSDKTRILGCMPSKNVYEDRPIEVDATTYRKRSAGGHDHFGLPAHLMKDRRSLVPPLDIILGNTMVMLDRDPGAAERRENYGRAGEYRLPPHGLEYRTLSNFWLKNYSLMSLNFGLANIALAVSNHKHLTGENIELELAKSVNIKRVIEAINTNNPTLARLNFEDIRPFLSKYLPKTGFPLNPDNLDKFSVFLEATSLKGLGQFFPEDPLTHWVSGKQVEFAEFLNIIY